MEGKTPEELANDINAKIKAIQETATSKEEATKLINEALETYKAEQSKTIEDLDQRVLELQEQTNKNTQEEVKTLKDIVVENHEDMIKSLKGGRSHEFEVSKATVTTASVANNSDSFRDAELSPLATKKLTIYDLFRKIRVGKDHNGTISYRDWNDASVTRAAAMIAEGGTFPESDAAWEELSIKLKKIGDSMSVTEEFKYDTAMFADELQAFLEVNVKLKEDEQLLSGDGTGNNTFGLQTRALAYTPVASGISDASHYDLVVKVAESITAGKGNKYRPNFVLMNLFEINKMRLKKDQNENYIMPPFVDRNGNVVAGIVVLEDNGLANNTMIVGDNRYGKIYEDESGYTITTGLVNNQLLTDEETIKARKRMCFLIKNSEREGFRYVSDIAAALTTLAS